MLFFCFIRKLHSVPLENLLISANINQRKMFYRIHFLILSITFRLQISFTRLSRHRLCALRFSSSRSLYLFTFCCCCFRQYNSHSGPSTLPRMCVFAQVNRFVRLLLLLVAATVRLIFEHFHFKSRSLVPDEKMNVFLSHL